MSFNVLHQELVLTKSDSQLLPLPLPTRSPSLFGSSVLMSSTLQIFQRMLSSFTKVTTAIVVPRSPMSFSPELRLEVSCNQPCQNTKILENICMRQPLQHYS